MALTKRNSITLCLIAVACSKKKEFFNEPDWPIRLAKECSEDLAGRQ